MTPQAQVATSADFASRNARLTELADELETSTRLLEAVTNAPAMTSPLIEEHEAQPIGARPDRQFSLSTIPALRAALGTDITPPEGSLLQRIGVTQATPVPVAAQSLQLHVAKVTEEALALADDPEFQAHVRAMDVLRLQAPGTTTPEKWLPDVDVSGRITPLGIGDLKVVKQTLLAYVPGEVAHIENILKGEHNERKHRKLDWTETTVATSEEEVKDTERDTQSTERFELKREVEQTIKEDMSIKAGLNVTAAFGPVVTTATGDFAYSTSKQDAQKGSSNFARELVDKSVSKVQTKTRTERTTRTHSEAEDTTTHGVDNVKGDGHIIGIYRWVDKRYRAQIYNYGIRLLLEFVVPEPAAFYRAARAGSTVKTDATPPAPFLNDIQPLVAPGAVGLAKVKPATPLTAADINENNYYRYAARYGASGISAPPPLFQYIGDSLVKEGLAEAAKVGLASDKFVVPAGYALTYYRATVSILAPANYPKFMLQIGTAPPYPVVNNTAGGQLVTTAHRATWRDRSDDRPSRWPHSLLGGLLRRAGLRRQP